MSKGLVICANQKRMMFLDLYHQTWLKVDYIVPVKELVKYNYYT